LTNPLRGSAFPSSLLLDERTERTVSHLPRKAAVFRPARAEADEVGLFQYGTRMPDLSILPEHSAKTCSGNATGSPQRGIRRIRRGSSGQVIRRRSFSGTRKSRQLRPLCLGRLGRVHDIAPVLDGQTALLADDTPSEASAQPVPSSATSGRSIRWPARVQTQRRLKSR
jgi:hypothetical protein